MKKILMSFIIVYMACPVLADVQTENEQLARINSVLNAVYPLIAAAKNAAPKGQRVNFHYAWLENDIESIQAGIAQKINQTDVMPRTVAPLKTQYVALTDKEKINP